MAEPTAFDQAVDALYLIGRNVRAARQAAGPSQAELGARIGLGRASVCNIELGRQHLTLHAVVAVAQTFGVAVADLLGAEPPTVAAADRDAGFRRGWSACLKTLRMTVNAQMRAEAEGADVTTEEGAGAMETWREPAVAS